MTHQRHIEDFFDLDNFVCKNFQESQHSAAESMEITTESISPDKLEINYRGDNPLEVNENFSQQFQSDVDVEAIESITSDLNFIKPVPRSQPIIKINTNRNISVHALGENTENASTGTTLKSFLEEISLGHRSSDYVPGRRCDN